LYTSPTNGGIQKLKFINEPNLYRVIFDLIKRKLSTFKTGYLQRYCRASARQVIQRQTAFDELNRLYARKSIQGQRHISQLGMHRRKHEKHLNAVRIETCKNLQLTFEGVDNE
jgi:hypothetical protein